jgi:predicted DCC family thiol-disulfide oxidoreductase YuxK
MTGASAGAGAAQSPAPAGARPLLIYDGDCSFCTYWARYWRKLTGERVDFSPYQAVAARYPAIPLEDFRRAVQYIAPDGRRSSAAEASLLTLSHAPGRGIWLALYRRMPGFASVAEGAYAFTAAHRAALYRLSLLLWGRDCEPPRHELGSFLFLRLFGPIYLAAFVSFSVQCLGLIGSHGILPLTELNDAVARGFGAERFYLMPTVFWASAGDFAIRAVCWAGAGFSLLLVLNLLPRVSLVAIHLLYLSLLYAGQVFMTYQWDVFLLETGFLALLLQCARTPGIWLLRWLLFRFMFMSGMVKLVSGDPNWWNLSALSYHFLTQPLPTPLAWYAAQLPPVVLKVVTGTALFIELVLPFFIFFPRRLRFVAAFGILLLQSGILATGNYNWFNLQTMLLCLPLFDDAALQRLLPRRFPALLRAPAAPRRALSRGGALVFGAVSAILVFVSLVQMDERFGGSPPAAFRAVEGFIEPLHLVSSYGLFAVMTTERDEVVIEGSDDAVEWREYAFRYKPGDVMRRPPWNIPHQPRLDWQMWFAALDDPRHLRWFSHFLERLLENDSAVTALLAGNPFPDHPPKYVRALFYRYTYAAAGEQPRGRWWDRHLLGMYFPAVSLKGR